MIIRKDLIELSHLTHENKNDFGVTISQLHIILEYGYETIIEDDITKSKHPLIFNILFKDGYNSALYKLSNNEASKLISNIVAGLEYRFVEYGTSEWYDIKLKEDEEKNKQ